MAWFRLLPVSADDDDDEGTIIVLTTADTITTTAAQLLGFLLQIRVCEVEPASVGVG